MLGLAIRCQYGLLPQNMSSRDGIAKLMAGLKCFLARKPAVGSILASNGKISSAHSLNLTSTIKKAVRCGAESTVLMVFSSTNFVVQGRGRHGKY